MTGTNGAPDVSSNASRQSSSCSARLGSIVLQLVALIISSTHMRLLTQSPKFLSLASAAVPSHTTLLNALG